MTKSVTLTKANRDGSQYDMWYYTDVGRVRVRVSVGTILKAVLHWRECPFKKDKWK